MKIKPVNELYAEGWERIFGKKKNEPRMLTAEEQVALREDLKMTVEIARDTKVPCPKCNGWYGEVITGDSRPCVLMTHCSACNRLFSSVINKTIIR